MRSRHKNTKESINALTFHFPVFHSNQYSQRLQIYYYDLLLLLITEFIINCYLKRNDISVLAK